jgi:calcineurin-like phosphoesterase family protein
MWFFTSDWHLNHSNIIKYCDRPFLSQEETEVLNLAKKGSIPLKSVKISSESVCRMNDCIISATNSVVEANDNLVIIGDFCWTSTPPKLIKSFVEKINCKNLYLIWGNHDNRQILKPFFKATYDHYCFHIEGQHIFTSHYPCRSWYLSNYNSWMLYGHVHNKLWHQDNESFTLEEKSNLKNCAVDLLDKTNSSYEEHHIDDFLESLKKFFRKPALTLDVGVDNVRENVPFGTPWSFTDIRDYMERKILNYGNA